METNTPKPLSGAEQKVNEYIERIISTGESKEKILEGLPPSFRTSIEEKLKAREIAKKQDAQEIDKLKQELGITQDEKKMEVSQKYPLVADLVRQACEGKKQATIDLYEKYLNQIDEPDSRCKLIKSLFQSVYDKYRNAEYPSDSEEESVWEKYLKSTNIRVDNRKSEWMYRGVFNNGESTEDSTRCSFNVRVTPELIDALDNLIISGKIKANYKFGQPGTPASPNERHDSISMYFLEKPNQEMVKELEQVIKPFVRGDSLLGKKITEGFFMSEIGSVKSEHIVSFVEKLKTVEPAFADALKEYTSPRADRGTLLQMSEAQFYAIKDVAKAFDYDISYDQETGFEVL
jgi:hypothetical protein